MLLLSETIMLSTSESGSSSAATAEAPTPATGALAEEQRASPRKRKGVPVRLTGVRGTLSLECTAEDISEGGVYVRVPVNSGLSVGQRCELNFLAHAESGALAGEKRYATVVRTKPIKDPTITAVGAGLRFDQPVYL